MAGRDVFVDTNVLVFANQASAPLHRAAYGALETFREEGTRLWISRQVLREYAAVMSRPQAFSAPLAPSLLVARVEAFQRLFLVADETAEVTRHLGRLLAEVPVGGRQVHDANIVATMLAFSVPRLITHNVADFARFGGLVEIVPLQDA